MTEEKLGTDNVFEPGDNKIFVFGSNMAGIHGAGAALSAYDNYGAIFGIGEGLINNSYAIPTKDKQLKTLSLDEIERAVRSFVLIASTRPELDFFVTRIGCGL